MQVFHLIVDVTARHDVLVPGETEAAAKRAARKMVKEWQQHIAEPDDFAITVKVKKDA